VVLCPMSTESISPKPFGLRLSYVLIDLHFEKIRLRDGMVRGPMPIESVDRFRTNLLDHI